MKPCFQRALCFAKSEAVLTIAALLAVGLALVWQAAQGVVLSGTGYTDYNMMYWAE